tara:strand:- start:9849 stop:11897 length:2049 start_codon:yes stop_codon:yes gene_type:complete
MSTIDYGFFEALTGPLQSANEISQNRDQERLRNLQLQEQEFALQQRETDRQNALAQQMMEFSKAAHADIFTPSHKFTREKDAQDYAKWYHDYSGYTDIEQILKQYGSLAQAYRDPRLQEALNTYKQRVSTPSEDPTKGNPILFRAQRNFQALELYKRYAMDGKNKKYLTSNSHSRYQAWKNGETDNFIYTGVRGPYLDNVAKEMDKSQQVDLETVLSENFSSVQADMVNDLGRPANSFSTQDMLNWLGKELNYNAANKTFAGQSMFGAKDVETDYATEVQTAIDATRKNGISTGSDYFRLQDQGISYKDVFDSESGQNWDRLGGYDRSSAPHSTMRSPVSKGYQLVAGGQVLVNDRNLETAFTNSWAGTYDDGKTPRYNSSDRKIYGVQMKDTYDRRGHKITDQDIASTWLGGKDLWQESETMDLNLNGYFVALEATNAEGDSFLLVDVANEKEKQKLKDEYGDVVFKPTLVAELIDKDLGPDDPYYKKVDMGIPSIRTAINSKLDSDALSKTLNQMATYEEKVTQRGYQQKQLDSRKSVLLKQMKLDSQNELDEIVARYDNSLGIGLSTAGVPTNKIQQAIPMIIADLYVNSQKQKDFPVVLERDAQGNPTKQATNPYQLMAFQAQQLKYGLINRMEGFDLMLEAIKQGNYDAYRKGSLDPQSYKASKGLGRRISQYINLK